MPSYYIIQNLRMSAAASNVCSTMLVRAFSDVIDITRDHRALHIHINTIQILPQAFQLPLGLLTDTVRNHTHRSMQPSPHELNPTTTTTKSRSPSTTGAAGRTS
jgi:hypothetical protein